MAWTFRSPGYPRSYAHIIPMTAVYYGYVPKNMADMAGLVYAYGLFRELLFVSGLGLGSHDLVELPDPVGFVLCGGW